VPLALGVVAIVAAIIGMLGLRAIAADARSRDAARVIEAMRQAPFRYDFSGTVAMAWRDDGSLRHADAVVRSSGGSIEVESGSRRVVDDEGDVYVFGNGGWSSVLAMPAPEDLPAPDSTWALSTRPGPPVAGRPTTLVEATRRGGTPALKVLSDTATGLLLERQVLDGDGRVVRSITFTDITVGPSTAPVDEPRGVSPRTAPALATVPATYRAPREAGAGYALVARAKKPGGGIELTYSDGLFTATVTEQRGDVAWDALPARGHDVEIGGHDARTYAEPGGAVFVWQGDDVAYTCVTDAPADAVSTMVAGLSPSSRSTVDQVVDYVLGPFGWG
jgi:sigma-E factor negative regulatory protein RseB